MSLGNFITRIKNRLLLEADAYSWARSVAHVRKCQVPDPTKLVVFCDLFGMTASAKVQAIYAAMLRQEGYQSAVLLRGPSPIYEKIYRCIIPDVCFVYLCDYIQTNLIQEAEDVIAGLQSSEDILTLERNGCRVGKNALSYAVRRLRVGTLDLENEAHVACFKEVLAESLSVSDKVGTILDDLSPSLAVFLERGYTPAGEFFDKCIDRGIRTVQWLGAPQSDSLLYKAYNKVNHASHPLALSDETWDHLVHDVTWNEEKKQTVLDKLKSHYSSGAWFNRQQLQTGKTVQSKQDVLQKLGLDYHKKTAVIFSHIFYDATFFYGDSLYPDYRRWLLETIRYAIQNPHINWIVKVHPVNVWRSAMDGAMMEQLERAALEEEFGPLPDHIKIMPADTDVNTFSLFEFIDYGLTVRGTIGMELPCFGIPVVTAGSGRYNGRGFTIDPKSVEEYRETILNLHKLGKLDSRTQDLACRYAYGTFFMRPIKMESYKFDYEANTYGAKVLAQNTFVTQPFQSDWPNYADLRNVSDWLLSESEEIINI